MTALGYTGLQAARLATRIDRQAAKVCDEIAKLADLVPDTNPHRKSWLQDQVMTFCREQQDVVRRRRR